jgi:hypothetical protein
MKMRCSKGVETNREESLSIDFVRNADDLSATNSRAIGPCNIDFQTVVFCDVVQGSTEIDSTF